MFAEIVLEGNIEQPFSLLTYSSPSTVAWSLYLHIRFYRLASRVGKYISFLTSDRPILKMKYYQWIEKWHFRLFTTHDDWTTLTWRYDKLIGSTNLLCDLLLKFIDPKDISVLCDTLRFSANAGSRLYFLRKYYTSIKLLFNVAIPNTVNTRTFINLLSVIQFEADSCPDEETLKVYQLIYDKTKQFIIRSKDPSSILKFWTHVNDKDKDIIKAMKQISLYEFANCELDYEFLQE